VQAADSLPRVPRTGTVGRRAAAPRGRAGDQGAAPAHQVPAHDQQIPPPPPHGTVSPLSPWLYRVSPSFTGFLPSFTGCYWVLTS